jgi:hypothetical protein
LRFGVGSVQKRPGEWTGSRRQGRTDRDTPTPGFFVSADSKGFTWEVFVSADSAGVKVAVFSMSWEWPVSADSKEVMVAICLQKGKQTASADSKQFRRTAWRGRILERHEETAPN